MTTDEVFVAKKALDEKPIPYPRHLIYEGCQFRIRSENELPEFLNTDGEWCDLVV